MPGSTPEMPLKRASVLDVGESTKGCIEVGAMLDLDLIPYVKALYR